MINYKFYIEKFNDSMVYIAPGTTLLDLFAKQMQTYCYYEKYASLVKYLSMLSRALKLNATFASDSVVTKLISEMNAFASSSKTC